MQERGDGHFRVIGQPIIHRNAYDKVTGKQQFISDMYFPNSLWAVVVRSPHARADVQSIDTRMAFDCPGVVAVYTADDVPQRYFNTAAAPPSPQLDAAADRLLLTKQAQHVGDGVAVVIAKSRKEALTAAKTVRIDWDILPPVLTLDEALEQGNILGQVAYGEEEAINRAFASSELLIAETFRTSPVQHMCLEPHACAAVLEQSTGHLTIWSNTQAPSDIRRLCAEILDFPLTRIRVCKIEEGGGFGCKQELHEEALVAWLATALGQTVQLRYTREEEFTASRGRHGASVEVRLGFRRDGALLACDLNAVLDSGAYASHAPHVIGNLGSAAVYSYPYATHRFQGLVVQTNTLTGGGYRGYGFPQANFALEQAMDMAAQALQIDPVELRRRNAARSSLPDPFFGDQSAERLQMCLDVGVQTFGWTDAQPVIEDDGRVRANGMATAALVSITSPDIHEASTTTLRWNEDGSVTILIGSCDCGTGSSTVMAQIVAEELNLPLHAIDIREGDTDTGLVDLGSFSQRTVHIGGGSVRKVAIAAREKLLDAVSTVEKRPLGGLYLQDHCVFDRNDPLWSMSVGNFCRSFAGRGNIIVTESYRPQVKAPSYGACFVTIVVDPPTATFRVERCVTAIDCGRVLNPLGALGQVYGGVAQGLSAAIIEQWSPNALGVGPITLQEHGISGPLDIPLIEACFVPTEEEEGPYGAKGLGEVPIVPVAAAVANAVARAVEARCKSTPLRSATIWTLYEHTSEGATYL